MTRASGGGRLDKLASRRTREGPGSGMFDGPADGRPDGPALRLGCVRCTVRRLGKPGQQAKINWGAGTYLTVCIAFVTNVLLSG